MAVPGKGVLYVPFNRQTVTQTNTSETDGYFRGKGQWQSLPLFSLPSCHVVLLKETSWQLALSGADINIYARHCNRVGGGKPDTDGL